MKTILKYTHWILISFFIGLIITSCTSDEEITQESISDDYITKAKEVLNGDIVLSTKAWMGKTDKTLLEGGCPTKFNFSWNEDGTMTLLLADFHVGVMPFNITFKCRNKFMKLNSFEKPEYEGEGWIKFEGKDGSVGTTSTDPDYMGGSGATVYGYLNVLTKQVMFIVDYNMMTVTSQCPMQTIDPNRINNFEEEFAKYEKDLAEYKKEHGI